MGNRARADVEERLLGNMILSTECVEQALSVMDSHDASIFEDSAHRVLFQTIVELHERNVLLDIVSVWHRLRELNLSDQVGGASHLIDLVQAAGSSADVLQDAAELRKKNTTL